MKAPWFPFYTGDFLASAAVQDMEAHEVGAYVLLMARSWQSDTPGYLEDDDYALRRAARLSAEQWAQSKNALLKKWPVADDMPGYRYNPRLKKEADKQVELREKKAEAGRRSAAKREAEATQRQQTGNAIPTGVEKPATGVEQKGNYSQPQSQPQAKAGGKEGPLARSSAGGKMVWPDEAPVFLQAGFLAFAKKIGYGHADLPLYLPQIQRTAEKLNEQRENEGWEDFILRFFNNETKYDRLMRPLPSTEQKPAPPKMPDNPLDLWGFNDAPPVQEPLAAYTPA